MKRCTTITIWVIILVVILLAAGLFNLLYLRHLREGCRTWTCTYERHLFQPVTDCTNYHIKTFNESVDCYACLWYMPVNGSTCYNNGLQATKGGYYPQYNSCYNQAHQFVMVITNAGLATAGLISCVGIIVGVLYNPEEEFITI